MTGEREKLQTWGICAALAVAVMAFFWGALDCDFVNYDDPLYITTNREIQHGLNARSVAWAFTASVGGNWHPATWLSHVVDVQIYGLKPEGHHLTNLLLHAANSVLLFLLLKRMTGAMWPSAMVAALFALHPLRVESVVWIAERKDVLSTLFWMLTVWMYVRYTEELKAGTARARLFYVLSAAFFALGLMAKPMLVTLPCVLLLIDYWPLNRFSNWRKLVVEKLPFFALSIASSVVTFVIQRKGGTVATEGALSIGARICNAFVSYVRYLEKAVWPVNLAVLYPHPGHWPAWQVIAAVVLLTMVTSFVLWRASAQPYLLVGWFWYLGMLTPVIGILQAGIQSMADRFTYMPMVGVFIMLVWGVNELAPRRIAVLCGGLALAGCLALTPRQVGFWKSTETLFSHAIDVTDKNYVAYDLIGVTHFEKGPPAEAMKYFQKSLEINPQYEKALNHLGFTLELMGRFQEAVPEYEKALKIKPTLTAAHNNLADALIHLGRLDEAMSECRKALDLEPHYGRAQNNYGTALLKSGRIDEGIAHLREAVLDNPDDASAHSKLGAALMQKGQVDEALANFQKSVEIAPADPRANFDLGRVLLAKGKVAEAAAHYPKAFELGEDFVVSHPQIQSDLVHIAWVLATSPDPLIRNGAKAIEIAKQTDQVALGANPKAICALAAGYAETGKFPEAVATARRALQQAGDQNNTDLVAAMQEQIKLYEEGTPLRDAAQR